MIFNKLVNELQSNNIQFNGELISPNYFRIITNEEYYLEIIKTVKIHQFTLLNINKDGNSQLSEYYFELNSTERNYLLSVVIDTKSNASSNQITIKKYFNNSNHLENYFKTILNN